MATSAKQSSSDVVEMNPANYRIDTAAGPVDSTPPFVVELVDGDSTHTFSLSEPDGQLSMDLEEAQTTRQFFALAFDEQWPDARPLIEAVKDRSELMKLALRYSRHFEIDPTLLVEQEEASNRRDRRAALRRRGRR